MANPPKRTKDDLNWDLLGDPSSFGLPTFDIPDNWNPILMGDPSAYGLPDDIFSNWGGGQGGDGTNGSADSGGSGGSGLNLGSIGSWLSRFLGGGSSGGSGSGSGLNLGSLLPLLAITGGGINQNSNINNATDAMLNANRDATDFLRGQLASTSGRFKPYTDAGAGALAQIQGMGPSNIAAGFKPLGSGRGIVSLGSLARGGR